ncbi:MAG TPA: hypothetical protein VH475_02725 [Tepidisphaeraceae bacterium]|jgi:hypothetical protein
MNVRHAAITLAIISLALLAGCTQQKMEARRDATVAALAQYPGNPQRSDTVTVAAVDYPADKRFELYNMGDQPITNAKVWVNQRFVKEVGRIPARGSVNIKYADVLEQGAGVQDLAQYARGISAVELQTPDGLFTVLGPSRK